MTPEQEYWLESLNDALERVNSFHCISASQKADVAKSLEVSHDNYGMAFYSPPSSDMHNRETDKLKQRIKELEQQLHDANLNFKKNVAMRRNCDPYDVTLGENGHAEYM